MGRWNERTSRRWTATSWFCGAVLFSAGACSDDGSAEGSTGEDTTSDTGDDLVTTIPVTSVTVTASTTSSSTTEPTGTDATDTSTDSDATGPTTVGQTDSSGSTTDASTGSDSGSSSGDSSSSSGGLVVPVDWCILQFPPTIDGAPNVATTAFGRVYVMGITDQTQFNDIDASIVAEFGFGDDGSDPAVDVWTWVSGTPNPGWDASMAMGGGDQSNNDEYQGDLSFPAAGDYDYAARFSADGGNTWSYCDLDGLALDGYTPAQAGAATIE